MFDKNVILRVDWNIPTKNGLIVDKLSFSVVNPY
jgi:3-phosphoglycerate kinase